MLIIICMARPLTITTIEKIKDYINMNNKQTEQNKQQLAIVGYGWAGRSLYNRLDKSKYDVDIYEKNDYFLNTHKLKYVIDSENIIEKNKFPNIKADNIDFNNLTIDSKKYDKIIMATGSKPVLSKILGLEDNCYFLNDWNDYIKLKNTILSIPKKSDILIIGNNSTTIELASNLSKIHNVSIITKGDILDGFSDMTKNYIQSKHN